MKFRIIASVVVLVVLVLLYAVFSTGESDGTVQTIEVQQ